MSAPSPRVSILLVLCALTLAGCVVDDTPIARPEPPYDGPDAAFRGPDAAVRGPDAEAARPDAAATVPGPRRATLWHDGTTLRLRATAAARIRVSAADLAPFEPLLARRGAMVHGVAQGTRAAVRVEWLDETGGVLDTRRVVPEPVVRRREGAACDPDWLTDRCSSGSVCADGVCSRPRVRVERGDGTLRVAIMGVGAPPADVHHAFAVETGPRIGIVHYEAALWDHTFELDPAFMDQVESLFVVPLANGFVVGDPLDLDWPPPAACDAVPYPVGTPGLPLEAGAAGETLVTYTARRPGGHTFQVRGDVQGAQIRAGCEVGAEVLDDDDDRAGGAAVQVELAVGETTWLAIERGEGPAVVMLNEPPGTPPAIDDARAWSDGARLEVAVEAHDVEQDLASLKVRVPGGEWRWTSVREMPASALGARFEGPEYAVPEVDVQLRDLQGLDSEVVRVRVGAMREVDDGDCDPTWLGVVCASGTLCLSGRCVAPSVEAWAVPDRGRRPGGLRVDARLPAGAIPADATLTIRALDPDGQPVATFRATRQVDGAGHRWAVDGYLRNAVATAIEVQPRRGERGPAVGRPFVVPVEPLPQLAPGEPCDAAADDVECALGTACVEGVCTAGTAPEVRGLEATVGRRYGLRFDVVDADGDAADYRLGWMEQNSLRWSPWTALRRRDGRYQAVGPDEMPAGLPRIAVQARDHLGRGGAPDWAPVRPAPVNDEWAACGRYEAWSVCSEGFVCAPDMETGSGECRADSDVCPPDWPTTSADLADAPILLAGRTAPLHFERSCGYGVLHAFRLTAPRDGRWRLGLMVDYLGRRHPEGRYLQLRVRTACGVPEAQADACVHADADNPRILDLVAGETAVVLIAVNGDYTDSPFELTATPLP